MSTSPWTFLGSRWWKFDFHAHTPASSDYGAGPNQAVLKQRTPREWLVSYIQAGIHCVAVTDHNCGDWIDPLKTELTAMRSENFPGSDQFHVFPGVELTINGAHYLAIFGAAASTRTIQDLLAVARYNNAAKNAEGYCVESISTICQEVVNRDGLFIPAHVDLASTGMFKLQTNLSALDPILKLDGIIAMEVAGNGFVPPSCFSDAKVRWTSVLGSDSHHPAAPTAPPVGMRLSYPGSHWTWVKMGKDGVGSPTLDSLYLALIDGPGVSIRRSDEPNLPTDLNLEPEEAIESIEISNTRVMGNGASESVTFNPWLNALVGGRGSGKSTVVHFLRLALRREGELEKVGTETELFKAFDRFRKKASTGVVNDRTQIRLVYRHQGVRYRINWPSRSGVSDVEEWVATETGANWQPAKSQEIQTRFPVRLFSQGQIAALAGDRSEALMAIIDQAVDYREWKSRWDEHERAFFSLRLRSRELEAKLQNRDRTIGALEDVNRKLLRFEAAEHAKVLRQFQLSSRQAKEVEKHASEARNFAGEIETLSRKIRSSEISAGTFEPTDAISQQAVTRVNAIREGIKQAEAQLQATSVYLLEIVGAQIAALNETEWQAEVSAKKLAYDKLVSDLQAQGVQNPSEYGQLVQDRQRLEAEVKALDSLNETLTAITAEADLKLQQLAVLRAEISEKRVRFLHTTLANDPYVQIELQEFGREPEAMTASLRGVLGIAEEAGSFIEDIYRKDGDAEAVGLIASVLRNLPEDKSTVVGQIVSRITEIKSGLVGACRGIVYSGIGARLQKRLEKTATSRPEFIDRILTWFPEDTLQVSYSPRGNGQNFVPILQGSAGQKAAAMLAFFLKYGTEPIVLDQPEDDLDNHLIYSLVVSQIRHNKQRRQIITVTHNPNIVVNGDAEMIHALDFRSGQCKVVVRGGLQDRSIREEICNVMEGGREAFEKRYQRIGQRSKTS